jgi:hypothetical protein
MTGCHDSPGAVEGVADPIGCMVFQVQFSRASVQPHPHLKRAGRPPMSLLQYMLRRQRRAECIRGQLECALKGVADNLKDLPTVIFDRLLQNLVMLCDRTLHGFWLAFPKRSAAFDIGKEKG